MKLNAKRSWILPCAALLFMRSAHANVLVDLSAANLPAAPLTKWKNAGTLGGELSAEAALAPKVADVNGRAAVVFDGKQRLTVGLDISAALAAGRAFTVEIWTQNEDVARIETVAAFAPPTGGPGTEFNFGTSAGSGAFRSGFKATTPYSEVPTAKAWHHIAWSYEGGTARTLSVYVDGELDTRKPLLFTIPPKCNLAIGALLTDERNLPRQAFSGAIARLRIYDAGLSQSEVRQAAGFVNAFAPSPKSGSVTDGLSATLKWQPGATTGGYAVYLSTDRAAVERADKAALKAQLKAGQGELFVPQLTLGASYFWRVDGLDEKGAVTSPGVVWRFTADAGLAAMPQPRQQNSNVPAALRELAWQPGSYATRQRVFFGKSAEELSNATSPAATLDGKAAKYSLPALEAGTRYYWRVDSDNGAQPATRGAMWTFRTQDALRPKDITFFVGSDTHYGRENNNAINRRVIDAMNALPGEALPKGVGGGIVRTPLGVVLNGDLLDEGFDKNTAPEQWAEFCRDYGLTGDDGQLCFPAYEGFGNHDGGPTRSIVRAGLKERNQKRIKLTAVSPNRLHYSWDWDHVHLVQLNLFGGSGPTDVKNVNGTEHDPELAIEFLREDLAKQVGNSGRPAIVFQHFGWLGGMADWWTEDAKERFYEAVKGYNVAALINGHSHGAGFIPWKDLMTIHDGSTARGEGDTGDFMVVRVTDKELIVAQRKLDGWGITLRRPLGAKAEAK